MHNELQVFTNTEFGSLSVLTIGEKPYFPASECAKVLGYSNPHKAIIDHCPSLTKREVWVQTGIKADGTAAMKYVDKNFIPEGDLYRLIIRSKLPSAVAFESWVCDEILPTIRKHGMYATSETLDKMLGDPDFAIKLFSALKTEKEKTTTLQNQVNEFLPKAIYYDIILQSKNAVPISIIAKDFGYSAVKFNRLLHELKIQFCVDGTWILYQEHADKGYTKTRTYTVSETKASVSTLWSQLGRRFLYDKLRSAGIYPLVERAFYGGDFIE